MKYLLDPEHKSGLTALLQYHVVAGSISSSQLKDGEVVKTVEKGNLFVHRNSSGFEISDETCAHAGIVKADVAASNGMVHLIDSVFVPQGVICPDTIFAAEQRAQARISAYGYNCRRSGVRHLTKQWATKPVGLAVDSAEELVFFSNDYDYPHGANASWITKIGYSAKHEDRIINGTIDPQGVDVDPVAKKLYFTQHYGNSISRSNYDGTDIEVLVEHKGNLSFQPSDVAVDSKSKRIFATVEGEQDAFGALIMYDFDGKNETVLKTGLHFPYGLCVDEENQNVFYVQGGHGGSISCHSYGNTPCKVDVVADILEYPYMCQVDSSLAKYGGPTIVLFSEANRPGNIFYVTDDGVEHYNITVVNSTDLEAPMGVDFGCQARDN